MSSFASSLFHRGADTDRRWDLTGVTEVSGLKGSGAYVSVMLPGSFSRRCSLAPWASVHLKSRSHRRQEARVKGVLSQNTALEEGGFGLAAIRGRKSAQGVRIELTLEGKVTLSHKTKNQADLVCWAGMKGDLRASVLRCVAGPLVVWASLKRACVSKFL